MRILLIGSGGREHALIWALRRNANQQLEIFCAPGNAGIAEIAECVPISVNDLSALRAFAHERRIELTIVGPASHVKKIEYAVTDPIDVAAVVGQSQFQVNAFVGDPHVRFEKPVKISVTVFMEKKR